MVILSARKRGGGDIYNPLYYTTQYPFCQVISTLHSAKEGDLAGILKKTAVLGSLSLALGALSSALPLDNRPEKWYDILWVFFEYSYPKQRSPSGIPGK
jgi:hypothetical protein